MSQYIARKLIGDKFKYNELEKYFSLIEIEKYKIWIYTRGLFYRHYPKTAERIEFLAICPY